MVLFFLPHAGGSAKSYCSFKRFLPKSLQVIPMEIAGRGTRSNEPLFTDISDCCRDILSKHRIVIGNEEYAIFGHSMGTMLACELVKQIREQCLPEPKHIFLSGRCCADEDISILSDDKNTTDDEIASFFFSKALLPKPTAGAEELMAMLQRILCADVRMVDKCRYYPHDIKFRCDITVLYGKDDEMLDGFDMSGWQRMTDGKCHVYSFEGAHFYYQNCKEDVCRIISDTLGIV